MIKICENTNCKKEYEALRSSARFCSDTCRQQHNRGTTTSTVQLTQPEQVTVKTVRKGKYDWFTELYEATVAQYPSKEGNIRAKVEGLLNNITHGLTKV